MAQPDCPDCECPQVRIDEVWIACPEECGWSEVWADTPDGLPRPEDLE
jgi:hypothetical protein